MINVANGLTKKEAVAQSLVHFFSAQTSEEGYLYIGYPVFGSEDGLEQVGALLISPKWGVVSFDLRDDRVAQDNYKEGMDDNYNRLESKFRNSKNLVEKRKLKFSLLSVVFNPRLNNSEYDDGYPVLNEHNLQSYLDENGEPLDDSLYKMIISSVQAISNLRKNSKKEKILRYQIQKEKNSKNLRILLLFLIKNRIKE